MFRLLAAILLLTTTAHAQSVSAPNACGAPALPVSGFGLTALKDALWEQNQTIRVRFLEGSSILQSRVESVAKQWERHGNLKLQFVTSGRADLRIAFGGPGVKSPTGSWSYIGTQNWTIRNQNEATMNFGWLRDNSPQHVLGSVVLHEFGHALGLVHEQSNPNVVIPWNRAAVLAYYARTQGWNEDNVEKNVFAQYRREYVDATAWDRRSIMQYPIDNQLTYGDFEVPWNSSLSQTDITKFASMYPKANVIFIPAFPDVQEQFAPSLAMKQRKRLRSVESRVATLEEQTFVTRSRVKDRQGNVKFLGLRESDASSEASQQRTGKSLLDRVQTLEEQMFVTRARILTRSGEKSFPDVDEPNASRLASRQRLDGRGRLRSVEDRVATLEEQMFVTRARMEVPAN